MNAFKRITRWTLVLAILAGGAAAFLAWQRKSPAAGDKPGAAAPRLQPAVAVTVAPVVPRPVQRSVKVVGTLYGFEEVEIAPKVDGRVARIAHDVGDIVRPGDVLLELDDTDYRLLATEAQRALELEMARLGVKDPPEESFDVHRLPAVERAELLEKNTRSKLERSRALYRRQATSKEDFDQAETEHEVAQANTRQAVLEVQTSLAAVRQREALLETARQKLRDTRVMVPLPSVAQATGPVVQAAAGHPPQARFEGDYVVAARLVSEGEMVHANSRSNLFQLVVDRPLKLMARVPERHVGDIRVGQSARLAVEAYPGETFVGQVVRVNPTVDRVSRTFEVEVQVANDDRRLRAGSFSKASILTNEEQSVRTIPEASLVKFAGVVKVFVVRDGMSHAVPVEPGARLEVEHEGHTQVWVEATGDLHPGDEVVTTGHSQLAEGTAVRVREAVAASSQK